MPETTTAYRPRVGDRVHVDPNGYGVPAATIGCTFVVSKVNPKNVQCAATDGGRGINFPAYLLLEGDAPPRVGGAVVTEVPLVEFLNVGDVVTMKRPMPGTPADLPYVILKDDGGPKVNLARLGGDSGRYVRAHRSGVVKRDLAWLTTYLATAGQVR